MTHNSEDTRWSITRRQKLEVEVYEWAEEGVEAPALSVPLAKVEHGFEIDGQFVPGNAFDVREYVVAHDIDFFPNWATWDPAQLQKELDQLEGSHGEIHWHFDDRVWRDYADASLWLEVEGAGSMAQPISGIFGERAAPERSFLEQWLIVTRCEREARAFVMPPGGKAEELLEAYLKA